MKKIYFLLFIAALSFNNSFVAQQSYITAPAMQTTTSSVIAPGGTSIQAVSRGCYLYTSNDLSVIGTNTAINSIGFYLNNGTNGPAVTGTLQVYLQNTTDNVYSKGANYTTAIAPMSSVYNNTFTIPSTGIATVINVALPANFTYTGTGMYLAFDWVTTGPFATSPAVYQADNTLTSAGAYVNGTVSPASNALALTNTRPLIQIGYVNTYTNEAQVYGIYGNGKQPLVSGSPYSFSVVVRNNAGVTMNNIVPTLSVSGANTFVTTTTITSLAAGATTIAAFPGYSPTAQGMNTVSVILPSDDNNTNNNGTTTQSTTCNFISTAPPVSISNFSQGVGFSTGSGLLLNRTRVPNTSTITALNLGIATYNPNSGKSVWGVITNSSGVILGTTNTVTITGPMFGTYQPFTFTTPVTMSANTDYFIGMAQPTAAVGYFPLAAMPSPTNNLPSNIYATSFLGGGFIFAQTPTLGVFAIEGVLDNGIALTVAPTSQTICSNNTAVITASGATTYSWSNGSTNDTLSVSPSLYTVYTCTGSAVMGTVGSCYSIQSSTVFVNLTPTINCQNGAICPTPGSFTLNPTGASTYTISGGSAVVSPTSTSNYTVTGTGANGCPAANTVVATVSVASSVSVTVTGNTLVCSGTQATLTASGAATYSWNNGSTLNSIIVTPANTTTYSVLGTFGSCTNNVVSTVSVQPQWTLTAYPHDSTICAGNIGTLTAFGQGGAITYSWSNGATTQSISVSPTVTTTYSVYGVLGVCSSSTTVTESVSACMGIEQHSVLSPEIKIYPNPNNGVFSVSVSSITDNSMIELYNGLGQLLITQKITQTDTNANFGTLPKGVYILRLKENTAAVRTVRMIVQ